MSLSLSAQRPVSREGRSPPAGRLPLQHRRRQVKNRCAPRGKSQGRLEARVCTRHDDKHAGHVVRRRREFHPSPHVTEQFAVFIAEGIIVVEKEDIALVIGFL